MNGARMALVACAIVAALAPAAAQTYPERPVPFIVPYGAGGPLDTVARIITDRMRSPLNQGTVIENVAGASGTIGVGRAVRGRPRRLHGLRRQLAHPRRQRSDVQSLLRPRGGFRARRAAD